MEKQRKIKILSIIALVLAICALSLGYAAFSASLNISSSATVSPNSSDFNVMFCDSATLGYCNSQDFTLIDSELVNGATNSDRATINGNLAFYFDAAFTNTNQSVIYKFYVHNIGEYDAYLRGISYTVLDNGTYKKCSATTTDSTKATDSLVQAACDGINITVSIGGNSYAFGSNISGHKLSKGTSEEILFTIEYAYGSALVDGPFEVEISDFKLDYSTVDNVNLLSFIILDNSYQGVEGSTWGDWVKSVYNTENYVVRDDGKICESSDSSSKCLFTCDDFCGYVTSDMQIFESGFTMN